MLDFNTASKSLISFISEKGPFLAGALTAIAFFLSASKSVSRLFERISEIRLNPQLKEQQHRVSRAADLYFELAKRPAAVVTPPAQRRRRERQRHAARRLLEVQTLWKRQKRTASLASFINGLLVAAHYLVGATLASSFVQNSLSPKMTGTLGLVVVIASTIQQRYTPDVLASSADEKAASLHRAIVEAEDALVEADREKDGADFQTISGRLSSIIVDIQSGPRYGFDKPPSPRETLEADSEARS